MQTVITLYGLGDGFAQMIVQQEHRTIRVNAVRLAHRESESRAGNPILEIEFLDPQERIVIGALRDALDRACLIGLEGELVHKDGG